MNAALLNVYNKVYDPEDLLARFESLTKRERTAFVYIALGFGNNEIATAFGVTADRIKQQKALIKRKFNASGLPDLIQIYKHIERLMNTDLVYQYLLK